MAKRSLKSPRYKTLGFRVTITLRKLAPKNCVHFYRFEGAERERESEDDDDDADADDT